MDEGTQKLLGLDEAALTYVEAVVGTQRFLEGGWPLPKAARDWATSRLSQMILDDEECIFGIQALIVHRRPHRPAAVLKTWDFSKKDDQRARELPSSRGSSSGGPPAFLLG